MFVTMISVKRIAWILVLICITNNSVVLSNNNSQENWKHIIHPNKTSRHFGDSITQELTSISSNVTRVGLIQYSDGDLNIPGDNPSVNENEDQELISISSNVTEVGLIQHGDESNISEDRSTLNEDQQRFSLTDSRNHSRKNNSTPDHIDAFMFKVYDILENVRTNVNISKQCIAGMKILRELIENENETAKAFLESSGRPEGKALDEGISYLGSHKKCVHEKIGVVFAGKYCLVKLNVTTKKDYSKIALGIVDNDGVRHGIGVCVPSQCSNEDISIAVNDTLRSLTKKVVVSVACDTHESHPVFASDIVVWLILTSYILVVVICTIYDTCKPQNNQGFESIPLEDLSPVRESLTSRLSSSPNMDDPQSPNMDDPQSPNMDDPQSPNMDDPQSPNMDDPQSPNMDDPQSPNMDDSQSSNTDSPSRFMSEDMNEQIECRRQNFMDKMVSIFSIRNSAAYLFSFQSKAHWIECIDGIKTIGMIIIILGHTCSDATVNLFRSTPSTAVYLFPRYFVMTLGTLAVDGFYLLSGLVLYYATVTRCDAEINQKIILKKCTLKCIWKTLAFYMKFVIRIYMRLVPVMIFLIMIGATVLHRVCSGPNYKEAISMYNGLCRSHWYKNALLFAIVWDKKEMCFGPFWYVSIDALFSLTVPPLVLLSRYQRVFRAVMGVYCLGSIVMFLVTWRAMFSDINTDRSHMFLVLTSYVAPYCIGIFTGYLLKKSRYDPISLPCQPYLLHFTPYVLFICVFILVPMMIIIDFFIWHVIIVRKLIICSIAVALGTLILATHFNCTYFGWLNTFLSWKGFKVASKLTYCAYLVHPVIMNFFYSCYVTDNLNLFMMLLYFLLYLLITYAFAIGLFLAVEHPCRKLEERVEQIIAGSSCGCCRWIGMKFRYLRTRRF